jgi:hypothetical protein
MEGDSEIHNVQFTGYDRTSSSSIGIEIGGGTDPNVRVVIRDVRFQTGFYYGIYAVYEIDSTLIEGVKAFSQITKAAIYIHHDSIHGARSACVNIHRCHISLPAGLIGGGTNYGIYIQGVEELLISQTIVNGFDTNISIQGDSDAGVWNAMLQGVHSEEPRNTVTGATVWSATAGVTAGDIYRPTKDNATGFIYKAQDDGTTGGTEPTWPTTYGGTVVDNTVTWEAWAKSIAIDISPYVREVHIEGLLTADHITGIEDNSSTRGSVDSWHGTGHDLVFYKLGTSGSFWSIKHSFLSGNFRPYQTIPGSGSDAVVVFTHVTWSNDNFGYVPGREGIFGYKLPVNFPYNPRATAAASTFDLDIREIRYVIANTGSNNVTIRLPSISLPDEGIEITVFNYSGTNNAIVDANTVGSRKIYSPTGNDNTRTISSRGGHLTLTPLSTPGGLFWFILSEAL